MILCLNIPESFHPILICTKFEIGRVVLHRSVGKDFKKFKKVFLIFHCYLPFEKGNALHLNEVESPSFL
jgi:hypothetical protein